MLKRKISSGTYIMDGLKEVSAEDFHSFIAKLRVDGYSFVLTVPKRIAKCLHLKRGDLLEVAIRKADEQTVKEYVPRPNFYKLLNIVECPKCGEIGRLIVRWKRNEVIIKHGNKQHYLCRMTQLQHLYPELWKIVQQMAKMRKECLKYKAVNPEERM